jgi:biopolymer transport protein ExbD
MSSSSAVPNKRAIPLVPVLLAVVVVLALAAGVIYLSRPVPKAAETAASQEAKAYLANLALSDVSMQASENLVNQKVVEVLGAISNNGPREVKSIDVYCLFYGVDGGELHRERLRIVGGAGTPGPLKPGATKSFRMPFDSLPDGWNQALPKMVIAQITFVN